MNSSGTDSAGRQKVGKTNHQRRNDLREAPRMKSVYSTELMISEKTNQRPSRELFCQNWAESTIPLSNGKNSPVQQCWRIALRLQKPVARFQKDVMINSE